MKKLTLIATLVIFSISFTQAQITIDDSQLFGSSRAFFAPISFNAGIIADSTFTHEFTFKNTSNEQIQLIGALTPEGVSVMLTDRFIEPDEEVVFYATLYKNHLENLNGQSSFALRFDLFFQEKSSSGLTAFNKAPYVIKGEFH